MPAAHGSRRAVRVLATARLISLLGGNAAFVALTLAVYRRTGSEYLLAATMLLTIGLGGVLSPILSHLGDRYPRRRVMIVSDLVAAGLFALLALVLDDLWLVLPLAFLTGVAQVPMISASGAAIPNLAGENDLTWANGLMLLSEALSVMAGPAIGGLLADRWGAEPVLVINSGSFLISAGIIATVRGRFEGVLDEDESEEFEGVLAGVRFLRRRRFLLALVLASSMLWFGAGVSLPADIPLAALFDPSGEGLAYGLIIASGGLGGVIGSIASRKISASKERTTFIVAALACGGALILAGLSPWLAGVLTLGLLFGAGDALTEVAATSLVQRGTPDRLRARVLGAMNGVQALFYATSFVAAGFILRAGGPRLTFVIAGVLILSAAFIMLAVGGRILNGSRRGRLAVQ